MGAPREHHPWESGASTPPFAMDTLDVSDLKQMLHAQTITLAEYDARHKDCRSQDAGGEPEALFTLACSRARCYPI